MVMTMPGRRDAILNIRDGGIVAGASPGGGVTGPVMVLRRRLQSELRRPADHDDAAEGGGDARDMEIWAVRRRKSWTG